MKNWKTTVSGVVSAAAGLVVYLHSGGYVVEPGWLLGAANFVMIGGIASLGLAAKDGNVTGGTVPQTTEAAYRVDDAAKK